MSIASQIRSVTLLLLMLSIWFIYSFWETSNNLEHQRAVNQNVQALIKGAFELNIMTNEYIHAQNERISEQWDSSHLSIEALFVETGRLLSYDDDKLSLKKIMNNEVQVEALFYQLERVINNKKEKLGKIQRRKLNQIISQIQVQIQAMLSEASRMSRRSMERLSAAEVKLEHTAELLLFIFWPIFIFSIFLVNRKIIMPIVELQKSAEKLSSGDYGARIMVKGNNEVSALASAYNCLAEEIEKKIKSLTDKSNRLNESQDELLSLNDTLQQMVNDQTYDLRNSETRQRAILESMHDSVITLDDELNIKDVNPAVETMFGYSKEESIGKNMSFLVGHSSGNKSFSSDYVEALGKRKDGRTFPIEVSLNEMEIDNEIMYTCIVRDSTERKRADKLKTEFVGTVSHELRTPLTAIRGSLGLVNGGVFGDIPKKAQELLVTAARNTERLLNLINDLLDIQKIEAGKMEFHITRVELMDALQKSVTDNMAYAEQYNVDIQICEKPDEMIVNVDPHRFSQIM
ncbi:MAG TPA: PAS domain S-box protein, partial [Gammaproteobacteria bacterium]|nr:PAS domain S-box protein [Gammaproteobacteria bacterium]